MGKKSAPLFLALILVSALTGCGGAKQASVYAQAENWAYLTDRTG